MNPQAQATKEGLAAQVGHRCERRAYLDLYAKTATAAERRAWGWPTPVDDWTERRAEGERGKWFEADVIRRLKASATQVVRNARLDAEILEQPTPAATVLHEPTIAAMGPHGPCKPDLVTVEPDGTVCVIEIKATPERKPTHEAELAYYRWRVERAGAGACAVYTGVIIEGDRGNADAEHKAMPGADEQGRIPWDAIATATDTDLATGALKQWIGRIDAFEQHGAELHRSWRTTLAMALAGQCAGCPWLRSNERARPGCWIEAERDERIEQIAGLRASERMALRSAGIATVGDLTEPGAQERCGEILGAARASMLATRAQVLAAGEPPRTIPDHPGSSTAYAEEWARERAYLTAAVQIEPGAQQSAGIGWSSYSGAPGASEEIALAESSTPHERAAMLQGLIEWGTRNATHAISITVWSETERVALSRSLAEHGGPGAQRLCAVLEHASCISGDHVHVLAPELERFAALPVAVAWTAERTARAMRTGTNPDRRGEAPGRLDERPRLRDIAWRNEAGSQRGAERDRAERRLRAMVHDRKRIERWIRTWSTPAPRAGAARAIDDDGLHGDITRVIEIERFHARWERAAVAASRMRPLQAQIESGDAILVGESIATLESAIAAGADTWRGAESSPGLTCLRIEHELDGTAKVVRTPTPAGLRIDTQAQRLHFTDIEGPSAGDAIAEWPTRAGERAAGLARAGHSLGGPDDGRRSWWNGTETHDMGAGPGASLVWPKRPVEEVTQDNTAGLAVLERLEPPPTAAQRLAVERALKHRVSAVLGPPGTGKSACAGAITAAFAQRADYDIVIALAAPTWRAVNAIAQAAQRACERAGATLRCLWQGNPARNAPPNEEWTPHSRRALANPQATRAPGRVTLVAGTARQIGHAPAHTFGLIVLDEAAQATPADLIEIAATAGERTHLVVAGDPHQLGPVRGQEHPDEASGHARSAWERVRASGAPTTLLDRSFRSNAEIAALVREAGYRDDERELHSAAPHARLASPHINPGAPTWAQALLAPETPITVVLWHGATGAVATETRWMAALVRALTGHREGLGADDGVGVIAWHRRHVAALARALGNDSGTPVPGTVDALQGAERTVVIIGLGIDDAAHAMAEEEFALEPRRLNVAWSRAKTKVVLFAHASLATLMPRNESARGGLRLVRAAWKHAGATRTMLLPGPGETTVKAHVAGASECEKNAG